MVFEYMGLPRPGNYYSWRGMTMVAVKSRACAVRPWNSAVVEVTLARSGKLLLEPPAPEPVCSLNHRAGIRKPSHKQSLAPISQCYGNLAGGRPLCRIR